MLRNVVLAVALLAACDASNDSESVSDAASHQSLEDRDAARPSADAAPTALSDGGGSATAGSDASVGTGGDAASGGGRDASSSGSDGGSSGTTNEAGTVDSGAGGLAKFSFFVTSLAALRQLSGSQNGFGGDLRFGETGDGAGLRGADKICSTIAETSMPGSAAKQWRAFLSTSTVAAKARVGAGPWYDRRGRLLAQNLTALLRPRPEGADAVIIDDFPNELGVPNHDPDGTGQVDNHDMLTGSGTDGTLFCPSEPAKCTCSDWTSSAKDNTKPPRVGHSWPRQGSGINWISSLNEAGCGAGINLSENGAGGPGPNPQNPVVGSGGGYGGFYCFALTP